MKLAADFYEKVETQYGANMLIGSADVLFGDFGWNASIPTADASEKDLTGYAGLPAQYHGNDALWRMAA